MKLKLTRIFKAETYTIGRLYIDGEFFCDVLEDRVRDLSKEDKVWGQTAIPYDTYKIIINYSNRFKRDLPLLLNVPQFEGIRIHPGNTAVDTHGCLLVGINTEKGKVTQSRITFDRLFAKIKNEKDLEIEVI